MNEIITQTLYFIGSYIGLVVVLLWGLNWLSKGWLLTFIKVKSSKGKLILTIVHSVTDIYFKFGSFDGAAFKFKDREGKERIIADVANNDNVVFQTMGVYALNYDIVKDKLLTKTLQSQNEIDSSVTDALINRAIQAPQITDKKELIIILLTAMCLVGIVVACFLIADAKTAVTALGKISGVI